MNEQKIIEIGTHATGSYVSDCYPFEVIDITPSGKTITIRELTAIPTENYDYFSNQEHTFESNPNGRTHKVRFSKNKGWKTSGGMKVSFGKAFQYQDPHY